MNGRVESVTSDLRRTADDAAAVFGSLSAKQLNWKPAEKSWSVAQCFDHLITTHSLYLPDLAGLAANGYRASLWQKVSPLSGFFGRFLIKSMRPENPKKMKTTAKAEPSQSEIGGDIIDRYVKHQHELIEHIKRIPADIDPARTIITSPLLGVVTYSLDDAYSILVVHGQRHLGQAKRVLDVAGFPAG